MVELVLRHELQEVVKLWLSLSTTRGRVLCALYSGASLQGTSWGQVLCPLYSGASLQGTS